MDVPTIVGTGLAITRGSGVGQYTLRTWVRSSVSPASEVVAYEDLSWQELIDLALTVLDSRRPGYQLLEKESWQPALWE